jgi:hypothetical protein
VCQRFGTDAGGEESRPRFRCAPPSRQGRIAAGLAKRLTQHGAKSVNTGDGKLTPIAPWSSGPSNE